LVPEKSGLDGPAIFKKSDGITRTNPSAQRRVQARTVRIFIILIMSKSNITPFDELR